MLLQQRCLFTDAVFLLGVLDVQREAAHGFRAFSGR